MNSDSKIIKILLNKGQVPRVEEEWNGWNQRRTGKLIFKDRRAQKYMNQMKELPRDEI